MGVLSPQLLRQRPRVDGGLHVTLSHFLGGTLALTGLAFPWPAPVSVDVGLPQVQPLGLLHEQCFGSLRGQHSPVTHIDTALVQEHRLWSLLDDQDVGLR